ncbi:carbohydrate kinase family protein [Agrococcus sp. SGAir0287]|uniref:carbohydrate kinase family protein n=1 Tax=Agrococcus sp. SGAir0287 TaxID=2070347 RepID=UPI0020C7EB97|nr:PfkB family carbohydrate kinase [Agrococcus sp. SGAir0287]
MRALVLGDVVDDVLVFPRGPIRTDTDTDAEIVRRPGGSAANTAAWMVAAGLPTTFVGRVAAVDAERHARLLADVGVDARIASDAEHETGTIVLLVDGDERTMLTDRGANAHVDPDDIDDALLAGVDVVHVTGYSLLAGHAAAVGRLVERAHAHGARVSCTIGSAGSIADLGVDVALAALRGVDVLVANRDEGALVTGAQGSAQVGAALGRLAPVVALTLGDAGVLVVERGAQRFVPAVPARLVDPTGAGDAFTAGFVAGIVAGASAADAATSGAELAARAVAVRGARPLPPTPGRS